MDIQPAQDLTNTFAITFLDSIFRGGEMIDPEDHGDPRRRHLHVEVNRPKACNDQRWRRTGRHLFTRSDAVVGSEHG